jgi:hypothetical protein
MPHSPIRCRCGWSSCNEIWTEFSGVVVRISVTGQPSLAFHLWTHSFDTKLSPVYYHWLHTHRWHLHVPTIRLPPHVRRRLRIASMRPRSRCAWKSTFSPATVSKAARACPGRGQSSCRVQCMQVPTVLLKVRAAIYSSRRPCRIISSSPPSGYRYCHISPD